MGRPSEYTEELGEEIALRLAMGLSLRKICAADDMPCHRTVLRWAIKIGHPFSHQYVRGRQIQADTMADDIIEISDEAVDHNTAAAAKVRVDARKWVASKLNPKRYADNVSTDDPVEPVKSDPEISATTKEEALKLLELKRKNVQAAS